MNTNSNDRSGHSDEKMVTLTASEKRALMDSWDFGISLATQFAAVERIVAERLAAQRTAVSDKIMCRSDGPNPCLGGAAWSGSEADRD